MKIHTKCVPCLINRIIFEAKQSTNDKKKQTESIKKACKKLSELYNPDNCSADIATKVHKVVYKTLKDSDPYKNLKNKSNSIAKTLVPKIEEHIKNSKDPLKTSMICSIIGNMMDFGIEGGSSHPNMLKETFDKIYSDGLGYDDYDKIINILKNSKHITFFTDNCGEVVFDKILCRELKKFNKNMKITLVVKGEPILSDATLKDAKDLNFSDVVDEILTTGCFAVGINFDLLPDVVKKLLKDSDLIICKGMANYESFSETNYRPITYLLRTKCKPIATSMDIPLNVNAIKLYQ